MEQVGKVYLVGAGPSDPGLLTVKGKSLIQKADVVVYDALVSAAILSMIPKTAKAISVGKRSGHHSVPQDQINEILLREALEGNMVVRLKGGDPFMFGRGGEELELLLEHDIPYEIVPGITSAISVPAYNGIPVTHRDYCSSLHIITAHSKKGSPLKINFKALCELNGTLVFLMGVTAMPMICSGLMEAGMSPDMPAAILQEGTGAAQRRVVATVSTLVEEAEKAQIKAPAVLVIGKVCALADRLWWAEKRPLHAIRVVLTRPKELISQTAENLSALGAEVIELPGIELRPYPENPQLKEALSGIASYQWVAFTSIAGVRFFFDFMKRNKVDVRKLSHLRFAVIGPGTNKELEKHGIFADYVPEHFYAEDLAEGLTKVMQPGENLLIARAKIGSKELTNILADSGISFTDVPLYDTVYESHNTGAVKKLVEENAISCAAFTSASTVHGFAAMMGKTDLRNVTAACIGEKTAAAAKEYGMKVLVAEEATIDSLTNLIVNNAEQLRLVK